MRARLAGVLGALGFVTLDPRDAGVLDHNRHDITEAGKRPIPNQGGETRRAPNSFAYCQGVPVRPE